MSHFNDSPVDLEKLKPEISVDVSTEIIKALNTAHARAVEVAEKKLNWSLNQRFKDSLIQMSANSSAASAAFTNLITCLAIKVAKPKLDVRIHQTGIGAPFNFRGHSESVVYPWLSRRDYNGAKSGWQTRTLERPKPYLLSYDENIAKIKTPFLTCFDEVQVKGSSALEGLSFLISEQIKILERKEKILAEIQVKEDNDISTLVSFFSEHFNYKYSSKGASRLPVLALYAVYTLITEQIGRYSDKVLQPLHRHSAADSQTKAMGDIEIANADGSIFEGFEVKHNIQINDLLIRDAEKKVMGQGLDRYYILTTHSNCKPDADILAQLKVVGAKTGCQIIVNGVIPTIQYYLRLISDPKLILPLYTELLGTEQAIDNEHRSAWAKIIGSHAAEESTLGANP